MNEVSFRSGLQEEWQALKDSGDLDMDTLYFCLDSHNIYKGALLFGTSKIENLTQDDNVFFDFYGGSATQVIKEDNNG